MWTPSEKETAAIVTLNGAERYSYFIKKIADNELIWSIRHEDGWLLMSDDEGNEFIPVWPHEKYVTLCIDDNWRGAVAEKISLEEWMEDWIPGIESDNRSIAVFPTPESKSVVISPQQLLNDLNNELSNYE